MTAGARSVCIRGVKPIGLLAIVSALFLGSSCTTLTNRRDLYNPTEEATGPAHERIEKMEHSRLRGGFWHPASAKAIQSGKPGLDEEE